MMKGLFTKDATKFTKRTKRGESAGHGIFYPPNKTLSVFNTMKVLYMTKVDPDVNYDAKTFEHEVAIYLADPDGWAQYNEFVPGDGKLIRLCNPKTIKQVGCGDPTLSCATLGGTEIWLNSERWMKGAAPSKLPLEQYRQYMVSHEMGHSLGYEHAKCPGSGPVPIMVQQTKGIGSCSPNTKITKIDLKMKAT
jgi:hypothetical protein